MVAGPATGGALLAHTIAGLLDSRRAADAAGDASSRRSRRRRAAATRCGRSTAARSPGKRVLLADDVRNTGQTFERCAALVREAGGTVIATVEIYDRMEAMVDLGVPNIALAEYRAPDNYPADGLPAVPGRAGR